MKFVAEVGSNWLGELPKRHMVESAVEEAARAGATAVKFQYFSADTLYSKKRAPQLYERAKEFELGEKALEWAAVRAAVVGVDLWASVFDTSDVVTVSQYVDVIKIASGDLNNIELISYVGEIEKPMAISTGGGLDFEIDNALSLATYSCARGRKMPILFYCVSEYPALAKSFRLGSILKYRSMASEIGLSDHSGGSYVAELAAAMGYTVFEKHFRPYMSHKHNPDYLVSVDQKELAEYIENVKTAALIASGDKKYITADEAAERLWARRGEDGLRPTEEAVIETTYEDTKDEN